MNFNEWCKETLINFLEFAESCYPKEMEKMIFAYDEMQRGN
jgi:hypothetical protein